MPRQDSVSEQMQSVEEAAVQMGCYDAVDWIRKRWTDERSTPMREMPCGCHVVDLTQPHACPQGTSGEQITVRTTAEELHRVRAQRDRYREALREIAEETGTPYATTALRALNDA